MKICFGCFEQYDDSFDICPHCGYAEGTEPGACNLYAAGRDPERALRHWPRTGSRRLQRDLSCLGRAAAAQGRDQGISAQRICNPPPRREPPDHFLRQGGRILPVRQGKISGRGQAPVRIPERGRHRPRLRLLLRKRNGLSRDGISRRHHAERVSEKGSRRFAAGTDRAGRGYQYAHAGHAVAAACA